MTWKRQLATLVTSPNPDVRAAAASELDAYITKLESLVRSSQKNGEQLVSDLAKVIAPTMKSAKRPIFMVTFVRGGSVTFKYKEEDGAWAEELFARVQRGARPVLRLRAANHEIADRFDRGQTCMMQIAELGESQAEAASAAQYDDFIVKVRGSRGFGGADGRGRSFTLAHETVTRIGAHVPEENGGEGEEDVEPAVGSDSEIT